MLIRSVLSEAGRNLLTGTTRAGIWALVLLIVVGGLAATDTRSVVGVLSDAQDFRDAGAATFVLSAPGSVDGGRCESLTRIEGVTGAGPSRAGDPVRLAALPSTEILTYDVAPSFLPLIGVQDRGAGVVVPRSVADLLGPAQTITLDDGRTLPVSGIYAYPEDGRSTVLAHTVLTTVPTSGTFDACWVSIWPTSASTTRLLRYALRFEAPASDSAEVTVRQLNATLGESFDVRTRLTSRPTTAVGWVAVAAGAALGAASVRRRRLELASSRHTGVPGSALTAQVVVETLAWALAGAVLAAPMVWWLADVDNPASTAAVWWVGLRTVLIGAGATVPAAALATWLTRERHLFRYFKDR